MYALNCIEKMATHIHVLFIVFPGYIIIIIIFQQNMASKGVNSVLRQKKVLPTCIYV